MNRPMQRSDMAALAASGEVTEDEIYEAGYRWHFAANAWAISPEAVGRKFVPSRRYRGLDGKWHDTRRDGGRRFAVSPQQYSAFAEQTKNALDDLSDGRDATILNSLGEVSNEIGSPGTLKPSGKIKGGVGLLHIVYSRMVKDGASLADAVDVAIKVADTVESGSETEVRGNKHHNRKGDIEAVVAVNPDTRKPVLTGYEIRADESGGENPASSDLRMLPPPLKDD
ncbi:MAG: hypothetical protein IJS46_01800, partial [Kiritimatiellae bacterium]|nr:hypothetical protein [Kiritimatiellia bacterium]